MVCFGFKGGIGTASRVVSAGAARAIRSACSSNAIRVTEECCGLPALRSAGHLVMRWLPCFDPEAGAQRRAR